MHIHPVLTLLSLLILPAIGFRLGAPHADARALIGRRILGVPEIPQLGIQRHSGKPRDFPLDKSDFSSPLVARSEGEVPAFPHTKEKILSSLGFKIFPDERLSSIPESLSPLKDSSFSRKRPSSEEFSTPQKSRGLSQPAKKRRGPTIRQQVDELVRSSALEKEAALNQQVNNIPDSSRQSVMYHVVSPNPTYFQGIKDIRTGTQSYSRKILDGMSDEDQMYKKLESFHTFNPNKSMALSRGQRERYGKKRLRPAHYEERVTTGRVGRSISTDWHHITPKTPDELAPGTKPWTIEDLRLNLTQQIQTFKYHEAGQQDSEYASLDERMRAMCNTEQFKILPLAPWTKRAGPKMTQIENVRRRLNSCTGRRNQDDEDGGERKS